MRTTTLLLSILSCMCVVCVSKPTRVGHTRTVQTQNGRVRGSLVSVSSGDWLRRVEVFLGLSYASLMGGKLRFMPPTGPAANWRGLRAATRFGPVCPQRVTSLRASFYANLLDKQSEECLNLNIYVPVRDNNETGPFPVTVFIHGETFESGTGNAYDGSILAAFGRIIVITMNYRLGALGFMSTSDSNAPGNYALLDIIAALNWVKGNVAAFGGDPLAVTLFGHGHGAALVNFLLASPVTRGNAFYKRAMVLAGTALSIWSISTEPLRYTVQLADALNCSDSLVNSAALVRCLKKIPVQELLEPNITAPKYHSTFGPVVNRQSVLPENMDVLLNMPHSTFNSIDLLVGIAKTAAYTYVSSTKHSVDKVTNVAKTDRAIRTYVRNNYPFHRQKVYEIISHAYTEWERHSSADITQENLISMLSDALFAAPAIKLLNLHNRTTASYTRTYFYNFHYLSANAKQTGDLPFIFGSPLKKRDATSLPIPSYTNLDRMLAEAMMTYVSNFIKSGDPNKPTGQHTLCCTAVTNRYTGLDWPKYDIEAQRYLHIGMRPGVRSHYRGSKTALWLKLIPSIQRQDGLDTRYHLLDDAHDESTFESDGTKPLKDGPLPTIGTTTVATTVPLICAKLTASSSREFNSRSRFAKQFPSPTRHPKFRGKMSNSVPVSVDCCNSSGVRPGVPVIGEDVSLSITIAVGCSLLFLNILIFFGTYYQRMRMKEDAKLKQSQPVPADETSSNASRSSSQWSQQMSPVVYGISRSEGDPTESERVPDYCSSKRSNSMHFHTLENGGEMRKVASTVV